jgi:hypothetical protein
VANVMNDQLQPVGELPIRHLRFEQPDQSGNLWQIDVLGDPDLVQKFADTRPLQVYAEPLHDDPKTIIDNEWKPIMASADSPSVNVTTRTPDPLPIIMDDTGQPLVQTQPSLRVSTRLLRLVIPKPLRVHYIHDPTLTYKYPSASDDVTLPQGRSYVQANLESPASGGTLLLNLHGHSLNDATWKAAYSGPGSNPVTRIDGIDGGYWLITTIRDTNNPTFSIRCDFIIL